MNVLLSASGTIRDDPFDARHTEGRLSDSSIGGAPAADGTYSVYLYKDGVARAQSVTVGRWSGKDWIITSGLKSGDLVIIDQIQKLRDKAKVALNQDKKTASKPTEK